MRKIPFNDLGRQYRALRRDVEQAVSAVLKSGWYLHGEQTREFEREFARYCGSSYCIAVANGTDALELALRAAGCGSSAEVITVACAGGYTTTACCLVGAVPVYVDVVPQTLLLDLDAALAAVTPHTRAIVATHLYGGMVDVEALKAGLDAMRRGDVLVIEDCAQSHGAVLDGCPAGSLGDMATFSFYPTKNLGALGDGGAVLCKRSDVADLVRRLAQYGWAQKYQAVTPLGRNSRLDELQAAILRVKLPLLKESNGRRREIIARYRSSAPPGVQVLPAEGESHAAHLAVARCRKRENVMRQLSDAGVATAIHYPILDPDQPAMRGVNFVLRPVDESRAAAAEIFSLPCFPELTDAEVDYVCERLSEVDAC